jgi:cytidylate kinase
MSATETVPIITIDGPTASGKGTVAARVAEALGFHYLDSGALYRLTGLAATLADISIDEEAKIAQIAESLDIRFQGGAVYLDGQDVTEAIRTEASSQNASKVAALPRVRQSLTLRQRAFAAPPGLVADGRDMGSVIFPDATLKIFLTATPQARGERRTKQLKQKGISAIMTDVVKELVIRDERDSNRPVAPLKKLPDAYLLDTTTISADDAVSQVLAWFKSIKEA